MLSIIVFLPNDLHSRWSSIELLLPIFGFIFGIILYIAFVTSLNPKLLCFTDRIDDKDTIWKTFIYYNYFKHIDNVNFTRGKIDQLMKINK